MRTTASLFRHFAGKLKQSFRRWIVGQAEVFVDLGLIGVLGPEQLRGDASLQVERRLNAELKALQIVGMVADVKKQKRGNAFVARDVVDCGESFAVLNFTGSLHRISRSGEFRIWLAKGPCGVRPPSR